MGALLYSLEAGVCFRVCVCALNWLGNSRDTPVPTSQHWSVGTLRPTLGFYMGSVNLNTGAHTLPFEPSP